MCMRACVCACMHMCVCMRGMEGGVRNGIDLMVI